PTISRTLRETLFTQGQTRSLSESDFELYKKKSSYHCERNETVLISNHSEIDWVINLETLNSLKDFSS
ncbi:16795_t:CDS:1, partial [Funneliformis geosporum]